VRVERCYFRAQLWTQQRERDQPDLGFRASVTAHSRGRGPILCDPLSARKSRRARVSAAGFFAENLLADSEQIGGLAREQIELERIADQFEHRRDPTSGAGALRDRSARFAFLLAQKII